MLTGVFLNGKIFKLKKGLSSAMKIIVSFNLPIIQFYHLFSCIFPNFQRLFKKKLVYFFSSPSKNGLMICR